MDKGGGIRDYLRAAIEGRRPSDVVGCLDEERLLAFYSTEMMDSETEAIRDHLADCPRCLNLAREAKEFLNAIEEPLRSPPSIGLAQREPERARARAENREWWRLLSFSLRPAVAYSMAAALLLMLISSSFLVIKVERLKSEVAQIRAGQQGQEPETQFAEERARAESLSQQLKQERSKNAELQAQLAAPTNHGEKQSDSVPIVASLILTPSLTRDLGDANTLTISERTTRVELRMNPAEGDYKAYRAVIRTADGDGVWESKSPLKPVNGGAIIVTVRPGIFVKHDHVLSLAGINAEGRSEEVGRYSFRVLKK